VTLPRPSRRVIAEDVLAGRVNIDAYPFRYMYLTFRDAGLPAMGRAGYDGRTDLVLTAVELLETRGWELVTLEHQGQIAYMRRVNRSPTVR
jgi:hypothetical protein